MHELKYTWHVHPHVQCWPEDIFLLFLLVFEWFYDLLFLAKKSGMGWGISEKSVKSTSREVHVCVGKLEGPLFGLVLGIWWLCVTKVMSFQGAESLCWDMSTKDFAVCFKSCNRVVKPSVLSPKICWALHGLRNAYHSVLCACGPWCMRFINIQGQRWRDVIMLLIPMDGVAVFSLFPVLFSKVMHIYACKTLMCLLMAKAIDLMERTVPRAVSQVFRHISLSKSPHISLVSLLISVSISWWMCWVQLLPWCHVVPAPGFSRYPFSGDAELLVRLLLMHVQPCSCCQQGRWLLFSQLVKTIFFFFFLPGNLCFACKGIQRGFCLWRLRWVQFSHQHCLV